MKEGKKPGRKEEKGARQAGRLAQQFQEFDFKTILPGNCVCPKSSFCENGDGKIIMKIQVFNWV